MGKLGVERAVLGPEREGQSGGQDAGKALGGKGLTEMVRGKMPFVMAIAQFHLCAV